uniref:Modification methylase, HemK family protein n=1 Tax=Paulinella longichromatophora TaxID=1708747 RepID=A0A2H4ZQ00_9EUKA|nr:modification methylase, HemK family protein [Paulinella longichromatophora]
MFNDIESKNPFFSSDYFKSYAPINILRSWRRARLYEGGKAADLDWLLWIVLGFSLQKVAFNRKKIFKLPKSLTNLTKIWQWHCSEQVPLQYLIGICPWRDLYLTVDSGVLIPRQETELLVNFALQCLAMCKNGNLHNSNLHRWADLGTGSGAIAVTLAKALPTWLGHAIDCSYEALTQTQNNLNQLVKNTNVIVSHGYWCEPLISLSGQIDLIVANPPYIPSELIKTLEGNIINHEPLLALDGGSDGLSAIRIIVHLASEILTPGGWILIEHHYDQSVDVIKLMKAADLIHICRASDIEGNQRFAIARKSFFK